MINKPSKPMKQNIFLLTIQITQHIFFNVKRWLAWKASNKPQHLSKTIKNHTIKIQQNKRKTKTKTMDKKKNPTLASQNHIIQIQQNKQKRKKKYKRKKKGSVSITHCSRDLVFGDLIWKKKLYPTGRPGRESIEQNQVQQDPIT